jgi:hypothetical protein
MTIEYILQRFSDNRDSTLGVLVKLITSGTETKTVFQGYTLEDQFNAVKIMKETRIPSGRYEIIINRTETPKTLQYRVRYNWFQYHLQLANVPGFQGIYIHIGNKDEDTDGCILLGDAAGNNIIGDHGISVSTEAFRRFYVSAFDFLNHQENKKYVNKAFITVKDEKHLLI